MRSSSSDDDEFCQFCHPRARVREATYRRRHLSEFFGFFVSRARAHEVTSRRRDNLPPAGESRSGTRTSRRRDNLAVDGTILPSPATPPAGENRVGVDAGIALSAARLASKRLRGVSEGCSMGHIRTWGTGGYAWGNAVGYDVYR